jgi:hypothetical protein
MCVERCGFVRLVHANCRWRWQVSSHASEWFRCRRVLSRGAEWFGRVNRARAVRLTLGWFLRMWAGRACVGLAFETGRHWRKNI